MIIQIARGAGLPAEDHVLADGEDRNQHEVLVDHADPVPNGVARPLHHDRLSVDHDLPGVGLDEAVQDIHQRALAGAILADKGVNLALADLQINLVIRHHAGKFFRDPPHLDGKGLLGHSAPGT